MTPTPRIIAADWLARPAEVVAPDLIGCHLMRELPSGEVIRGLIVETEAYGPGDPACHGYRRRTPRNEVMFGAAGVAYIYLIYGMYHCLNVVTDRPDTPSAVLIRALQLSAFPTHLETKPGQKLDRIAAGPGKLCRVLDIDTACSGQALHPSHNLWLEHRTDPFQQTLTQQTQTLIQTQRIGITQGADIPWRWYLEGCTAVSKRS